MNIASNPWSFAVGDPAVASITPATGMTLNANGTVTLTTTGAYNFNAAISTSYGFTAINVANALYNGYYKLLSGASGGTTFTLVPQFAIPAGTAASGSGTIIQCAYPWQIRCEDISWQNVVAAGDVLDLRDRSGNIIWQAKGQSAGQQNRGKIFWVNGLSPNTIASGVVLMTIN